MRPTRTQFRLLLLLTASVLTNCKKDSDTATGLAGTWRLVARECYCPAGPVPNETLKFTATSFEFSQDNRLTSSGIYHEVSSVAFCGAASPAPGIRFQYTAPSQTIQDAAMTLSTNTLVLNYGGPCDAPVDTYTRLP